MLARPGQPQRQSEWKRLAFLSAFDRALGLGIQVNWHSLLQETNLSTSLIAKGWAHRTLLFQEHLRSIAEGGQCYLSSVDTKVRSASNHSKLNTFPVQPSTVCLLAGTRHSCILVIFRCSHLEGILKHRQSYY